MEIKTNAPDFHQQIGIKICSQKIKRKKTDRLYLKQKTKTKNQILLTQLEFDKVFYFLMNKRYAVSVDRTRNLQIFSQKKKKKRMQSWDLGH